MKAISFEGIGQVLATFQCGETVKMGQVVKVSADGAVEPCAAGDHIAGMAVVVRDGCAAVQVAGFVTVAASGVSKVGWTKLSANGSGGMKADSTAGTDYLVVSADSENGSAVILL
ncbi:hypothetical protein [Pseudoflavonifractor phocaeensis]|uniref:hypothetical protein n=1 Tax=Pseudoflavonifractor phocaeensis TaxID=1870988 RepID=UPI00195D1965|nr:hypothetical protein [Pseudoflavonifractor phocaeensis]MBM6870420.1 hypothetical protein [Pseudoflavonifractor phocaeensis]